MAKVAREHTIDEQGTLLYLEAETTKAISAKDKAVKLGLKFAIANQKLLKDQKYYKERIIVLEAENFYLKLPWWRKLC